MHEKELARSEWYEVKAIHRAGEWVLRVLGLPYGGQEEDRDAQGEYFSGRTDFMLEPGDRRPAIYYHGLSPDGKTQSKPEVIGVATYAGKDEKGGWFDVVLDKGKELAQRVWKAAMDGLVKASSGAVNYLVRREADGELITWPVGELTLLDVGEGRAPANELATVSLKAIFDEAQLDLPEAFRGAEEAADAANQGNAVAEIVAATVAAWRESR